jgi:hypothetical protein
MVELLLLFIVIAVFVSRIEGVQLKRLLFGALEIHLVDKRMLSPHSSP